MTVPLRGHHLLCILTYRARGYMPAFVAGYDGVIDRLAGGEPARIVDGPDAICKTVADLPGSHCHAQQSAERDSLALADISALTGLPLAPGRELRLTDGRLRALRRAFADDGIRRACAGCGWHSLCTRVARCAYQNARLGVPVGFRS